jgi:hypothetical protein
MAGAATATFSTDVWTSPGSVDASQQQWDFAVPARQNVSVCFASVVECRISSFFGLDRVGCGIACDMPSICRSNG